MIRERLVRQEKRELRLTARGHAGIRGFWTGGNDPLEVDFVLIQGFERLVPGMGINVPGLPERRDGGVRSSLILQQSSLVEIQFRKGFLFQCFVPEALRAGQPFGDLRPMSGISVIKDDGSHPDEACIALVREPERFLHLLEYRVSGEKGQPQITPVVEQHFVSPDALPAVRGTLIDELDEEFLSAGMALQLYRSGFAAPGRLH